MDNDLVKMTVDKELIRTVVERHISAAIADQFGKTPELIQSVVHAALTRKVSASGNESSYSYENKYDMVEVLCQKSIEECAKKAVQEFVDVNRPKIQAAIRKHLESTKTEFVKRFIAAVDSALSPSFYVSCSLQLKETK